MTKSDDQTFNEEEDVFFDYDFFWEETLSPYDENYLARYKNNIPDHLRPIGDLIDELFYRRRDYRLFRRKIRILRKWIKNLHFVYASCFILFICGFFIHYDITHKTSSEVFEEYYAEYFIKNGLNAELNAFYNKDYRNVINNIPDQVIVNGKWLKAIALIEEEEFIKASLILNEINTEDSEWLNALCLMRAGDNMKAIREFEKIYLQRSIFSKKAKKLLEQHYYNYKTKCINK